MQHLIKKKRKKEKGSIRVWITTSNKHRVRSRNKHTLSTHDASPGHRRARPQVLRSPCRPQHKRRRRPPRSLPTGGTVTGPRMMALGNNAASTAASNDDGQKFLHNHKYLGVLCSIQ